ncbi:unnamed protein product [Parnassius mnemosyne]|uniref:Uncharacterized protein n=1 Tax=Parnassius mnemosyne TaxID=213953 RepID=A0AAV1KFL1_9NEOP
MFLQIFIHYLKELRQLSEKQINAKIDDYLEYISGKNRFRMSEKNTTQKTEEKADKIVKKANGTMKKGVAVAVLVKKVPILKAKLVTINAAIT